MMRTNRSYRLLFCLTLALAGCTKGFGVQSFLASGSSTEPSEAAPGPTVSELYSKLKNNPQNAFSLRRVVNGYTGPLVRLQRDSDFSQSDFSATTNGDLDREAVQAWIGSATSKLRLIKWYDQSGHHNDMVPIFSSNAEGSSTPRDYPPFVLDDSSDGQPAIAMWSHRMDFTSPLQNLTSQSLMMYVKDWGGDCLLRAQNNSYVNWCSSGKWGVSGEASDLATGDIANEWHAYGGSWRANVTDGWRTFRDGSLIAKGTSTLSQFSVDGNTNTYNVGYFRWYAPSKWSGELRELIVFDSAVDDDLISAFNSNAKAYFSKPLPSLTPTTEPVIVPVAGPALPLKIKGVNLAGAESGGEWGYPYYDFPYPSNQEIDYYASKGFTAIRFPFDGNRLQPQRGKVLDVGMLKRMDAVVQYARTKAMWVILDPHNFGYLNNLSGQGRLIGVDPDMPATLFADLWKRLATVYKNQPNVIFELMNEPHDQTAAQWKAAAVVAVNAIRATGATQKILVPGTDYTGAHSWISSGNGAAWLGFNDSNFMFTVHQYLDYDSSGTHTACVSGTGSSSLNEFDSWARTNGYKGLLGEFGWSQDSSCPAEGQALVNYMNSKTDVWAAWTYWSGGPWMGSYMYNLDADGIGTGTVTDKPQMSILQSGL